MLVIQYLNTLRLSPSALSYNNYTFIGYTLEIRCTLYEYSPYCPTLSLCYSCRGVSLLSWAWAEAKCKAPAGCSWHIPFLLKSECSWGCAVLVRLHIHGSQRQSPKFLYACKVFHPLLAITRGMFFFREQARIILSNTTWKKVSQKWL